MRTKYALSESETLPERVPGHKAGHQLTIKIYTSPLHALAVSRTPADSPLQREWEQMQDYRNRSFLVLQEGQF